MRPARTKKRRGILFLIKKKMKRLYVVFAAVTGAAFVSGIAWSMYSIFVSHDQTQVVAGVGLIGISAVVATGSFLLVVRPAVAPYRASVVYVRGPATGLTGPMGPTEETPLLSCEVDCEYESIMIATGDDTPPKVVFVERPF